MKQARFEVHKGHGEKKDGWFWELQDTQGSVGAHSRCYESREAAVQAIHFLKKHTANSLIIVRDEE
jgi:uncharacterized protein YegP (UPF0339 family)